MSEPKMFDAEYAVSTAPMETSPGAFGAKTTSLATPASNVYAAGGTVPAN